MPSAKSSSRQTASGRTNQKLRTRNALVASALRLLRKGETPTVSEVAVAALVSPATAYRYFPSAQSLWLAVLAAVGEPTREAVFAGVEGADLETRVATLVERVGFRMFDDEALWRSASRAAQSRADERPKGRAKQRIPIPTGQRMRWIAATLAPFERSLPKPTRACLAHALSLVIGIEAVVALRDTSGLDVKTSKATALWAARALARAALEDASAAAPPRPARKRR